MSNLNSANSPSSGNSNTNHNHINNNIAETQEFLKKKRKYFDIKKINFENYLCSPIFQALKLNSNSNASITNSSDLSNYDFEPLINLLVHSVVSSNVSEFHTNYYIFKRQWNFQRNLRKTKIDSMLKKCKTKFSKSISDVMKSLSSSSITNIKIPQSFITNINIDFNKKMLDKPLYEIFQSGKLGWKQKRKVQYQSSLLDQWFSSTYKDWYWQYLHSEKYYDDRLMIRKKEGQKFEILFQYVANIFIEYYSMSKGNKSKRKLKTKPQNNNNTITTDCPSKLTNCK